MKKEWLIKTLTLSIIVLFIVMTVTPSIGVSNYLDDTTPPVTTISTDPEPVAGGWYPQNVEITMNATDNESGVNATYYKINENGWTTYTQPFYMAECGINILQFYSVDNAGNAEDPNQVEIKIDCYPPILNYTIEPPEPDGLNGWYVSNITIRLNVTDNESGVCYPPPDKTFINITEDGECIPVELRAWDNVGNEAQHHTLIFDLDRTKPVISMIYEVTGNIITGWTFTFTATATDAMSGMERVEFYFSNVLQKTVPGVGPTYQWTVKSPEIPYHPVKAIGYDFAGNNATFEIEDPKPHKSKQTLPDTATQPNLAVKTNLRNFLLLSYCFPYMQLYQLIVHLAFEKNNGEEI